VSPVGAGTITPGNGTTWAAGVNLTVTATANSGYAFSSWQAPYNGNPNPFTLTMDANKAAVANFTALPTYTVTINPPANGTITINPAGPNYNPGTTVTLTATPAACYQFKNWGNDLNGITTSPATLVMNGNKVVSATFEPANMDNLGNHTATQNFKLGNYWLSNDGGNEGINILPNGNIGIGIAAKTDYLLTVNGKILTEEIEVVSNITADYVFEPEYEIMPLTELELYLKKNKHLPGIPSVAQFAKEGQNLGKMDDMLLRKIEELTLYILILKQEIDQIKSR
jgi:hypothetical protein